MNSPTPHPEFQKLQAERDFLRERLAVLAEEEGLLTHEGTALIARYYQSVGHLEVEVLRLEIEGSRTKREIEMIRAAQNRGSDWDYSVIQLQLDAEFASWQQKLREEEARLTDALDRKNHLLSAEEMSALQKLYRELVKRLHPDLNPALHPEKTPLWHRLQDAYGRADLEEMRLVEMLLGTATGEIPSSSNSAVLKEELERLRMKVSALIQQFDKQRKTYPFTLKETLDDPQRTDSLRADLKEKIRISTLRRDSFAAHLQTLLDTPGIA